MIPQHPAALRTDRRLWFGEEVEGSVKRGQATAFVSDILLLAEMEHLARAQVAHVFVTETFEGAAAWDWFARELWPWARRCMVSVTVGRYPHQVAPFDALRPRFPGLRLMVHVLDAPWVHTLKAGDEVAVGVPYHLWSWRLEEGAETTPADYLADREVER